MLQNIKNMLQPQVPQSVIEKAVAQAMTGNAPAVAYDAVDYDNDRKKQILRQLASELLGITTKTSNSMLQPISVTDQMKRDVTLEALLKPTQIAKDITLESWNDVSHGQLPEHGIMGLLNGKGYVPDTRTSGTQALESHGYDPNSLGTQLFGGAIDMAADPITYLSGLGAGKVAGLLPKASGLVPKLGVGLAEDATFGGIYGGLETGREGGGIEDIAKTAGLDAATFAALGIPLRAAGHGIGKAWKSDIGQGLRKDARNVLANEYGSVGYQPFMPGNIKDNAFKEAMANIDRMVAEDKALVRGEIKDPLYGYAPPQVAQPNKTLGGDMPNMIDRAAQEQPFNARMHPPVVNAGNVRDLPYMKYTPDELQNMYRRKEYELKVLNNNLKAGKTTGKNTRPVDPQAEYQKSADAKRALSDMQAAANMQGYKLEPWKPGKGAAPSVLDVGMADVGTPVPPEQSQQIAAMLDADFKFKGDATTFWHYASRDTSRAMRDMFGKDAEFIGTILGTRNPLPKLADALRAQADLKKELITGLKKAMSPKAINMKTKDSAILQKFIERGQWSKEEVGVLDEAAQAAKRAEIINSYPAEMQGKVTVEFNSETGEALIFEPYTLEDLTKEVGAKKVDVFIRADQEIRRVFDDLIGKINERRAAAYPKAEEQYQAALMKYNEAKAAGTEPTELGALKERVDRLERNRQIPYRENYSPHFRDQSGLFGILDIWQGSAGLPSELAGISADLKPKTKWLPYSQRRTGWGDYTQDAIQGFAKYIDAANHALYMDPIAADFFKLGEALRGEASLAGAARNDAYAAAITWCDELARSIQGKTGVYDRLFDYIPGGRKGLNALSWFTKRLNRGSVLGNFSSVLAQPLNLTGAMAVAQEGMIQGMPKALLDTTKIIAGKAPSAEREMSNLMKYRYQGKVDRLLDKRWLSQPGNFAKWMMETADRWATEWIWRGCYEQAVRSGGIDVSNTAARVRWADMQTGRIIADRNMGMEALIWRNKISQVIAPFQVEVLNQFRIYGDMKSMAKSSQSMRAISGLVAMTATAHLANVFYKQVTGFEPVFDPIEAMADASGLVASDEYSGQEKAFRATGRIGGELVANYPGLQTIAAGLGYSPDEEIFNTGLTGRDLFGRSEVGRFGTGIPFIELAKSGIGGIADLAMGNTEQGLKEVGTAAVQATGLPYSRQVIKTAKGAADLMSGVHTSAAGNDLYNVATNPLNVAQGLVFGPNALKEAREYAGNDIYTRLQDLKNMKAKSEEGKGPWSQEQEKELWLLYKANDEIYDLKDKMEYAETPEQKQVLLDRVNTIQQQLQAGEYWPTEDSLYGGQRPMDMPGAGSQEWQPREGFGITPEKTDVYREMWKAHKEGNDTYYQQAMRDLSAIHNANAYGVKWSLDYQVRAGNLTDLEAEQIVQDYYAMSTEQQQRTAATSFLIESVKAGDDAAAKKWAIDAMAVNKDLKGLKSSLSYWAADDQWKSTMGLMAEQARDRGDDTAAKEYLNMRDEMPESYILAGNSAKISPEVYNKTLEYLVQAGASDSSSKSGYSRSYSRGYSSGSSKGAIPLEQVQAVLNTPALTIEDLRAKYQGTNAISVNSKKNYRLMSEDAIFAHFMGQDPTTVEMILKRQGLPLTKIASIIARMKGGGPWQVPVQAIRS